MMTVMQSTINERALPTYQGYISVAPSQRYFQDENGQAFVVIGQNDGIPWPGLKSLLNCDAPHITEAYVKDLRAHGVNVSRVMIEYAQYQAHYFENPLGVFSPSIVQFWDDFITLAEKHGLYLLLTPYDTFWQVKNWDTYPYTAGDCCVCESKRGWLTSRKSIEAHKARWEFIIRRWGGSPNIFAWDIMNEIDNYWGCTAQEIDAYITEMAAYVRDLEMSVWGRTHMLTVSTVKAIPHGALADVIYNHPSLDFANTHLYVGPGTNAPKNAISAALEFVQGVRAAQAAMHTPRPYFDSESGPIDKWITSLDLDCAYHHNMSWAHLMSGGAGSGMRWPYTRPHCILPEMLDNLHGLARFAATIDWTRFAGACCDDSLQVSGRDVISTGCADSRTALIWLLRDTRKQKKPAPLDCLTLTLDGKLEDGVYSVEVWETYAGRALAQDTVTVMDGVFRYTLPAFIERMNDVAVKVTVL